MVLLFFFRFIRIYGGYISSSSNNNTILGSRIFEIEFMKLGLEYINKLEDNFLENNLVLG